MSIRWRMICPTALILLSGGCSSAGVESRCSVHELKSEIVGGTRDLGYLALTNGQQSQIVMIGERYRKGAETPICTGVIISPEFVLSAAHCDAFDEPVAANADLQTEPLEPFSVHPALDVMLFRRIGTCFATGEALSLMEAGDLEVGDPVLVSGFGLDENGETGRLLAAVERVREVERETLTVSGDTATGACLGDSGGPLLARSESAGGAVRVAGILSKGDASCRGRDVFVRTSAILDWLTAAGWRPQPGTGCGAIGYEGRCFDTLAVYCEGSELSVERCSSDSRCGWDRGESGYRCASNAVCNGDEYGACVEGGVERCLRGEPTWEACSGDCKRGPDGHAICVAGGAP